MGGWALCSPRNMAHSPCQKSMRALRHIIVGDVRADRLSRRLFTRFQHNSKGNNDFDAGRLDPSLLSAMDSGMDVASLSPYLPVPYPVAHCMLEMADAGPRDVHYELGSGDGRVNFCAVQDFGVAKSVGVEIDSFWIQRSRQEWKKTRLSSNHHLNDDKVSFIQADLMNSQHSVWRSMQEESTIVTMYFVSNALEMLGPSFQNLKNKKIVTCGYPIPNWTPEKIDKKHGLEIRLYNTAGLQDE